MLNMQAAKKFEKGYFCPNLFMFEIPFNNQKLTVVASCHYQQQCGEYYAGNISCRVIHNLLFVFSKVSQNYIFSANIYARMAKRPGLFRRYDICHELARAAGGMHVFSARGAGIALPHVPVWIYAEAAPCWRSGWRVGKTCRSLLGSSHVIFFISFS